MLQIACNTNRKKDVAKENAEQLLNSIAQGSAIKYFPEKYFPRNEMELILTDLKDKCDFRNKKGHFINDFYRKNVNGTNQISFIYEYYLKCDSIRFILTYNLGDPIELFHFGLEPIEKDNSMIIRQDKRLPFVR
jgi:hypothetical protein